MTNNDRQPDGVEDSRVSRLYRESATERAPAHLDNLVLAAARENRGNRYALSIRWMRPMAWAATIGLCVAVVLDVAVLPESVDFSSDVEPGVALPESAATSEVLERSTEGQVVPDETAYKLKLEEQSVERDMPRAEPTDERKVRAAEPASESSMKDDPAVAAEPARRQVVETVSPMAGSTRLREAEAPVPTLDEPVAAPSPEMVAAPVSLESAQPANPEFTDMAEVGRSAESEAEAFSSSLRKASEDSADAASMSLQAVSPTRDAAPTVCPAEDLPKPEMWLACIELLEAEGREEDAALERRLFEATFPNYALD